MIDAYDQSFNQWREATVKIVDIHAVFVNFTGSPPNTVEKMIQAEIVDKIEPLYTYTKLIDAAKEDASNNHEQSGGMDIIFAAAVINDIIGEQLALEVTATELEKTETVQHEEVDCTVLTTSEEEVVITQLLGDTIVDGDIISQTENSFLINEIL